MKKKFTFCNFTTILSILLIIYILFTTYMEYFHYFENIKTTSFVVLLLTLLGIFFFIKFYKNNYLEKQIKQRTTELLNENQTLKIHSHIDSLTQVLNQKHFMNRFEEELKRAIREKQNISLIIVNIDEFKAFNDIYGYDEGNECLKLVANILVNHCNRPSDLVSRFKGDEFYVLLPNTKESKTVSKKCIDSVKDLNIPHENSIASTVLTISIGVSSILPVYPSQKDELITYAKESLKIAKRSGRNRVN